MNSLKKWRKHHPEFYRFIRFNVFSNCATITNFVVMWIGSEFLFKTFKTIPFRFFVFDYTEPKSMMLCGFLSFLTATVASQIVNFFVQRKLVFYSGAKFGKAAWKYLLLAMILVLLSTALPAYSQGWFRELGVPDVILPTLANALNIIVQVVISYPVMKFWIMPEA